MLIIVCAVLYMLFILFGFVYSARMIRTLWRCEWKKAGHLIAEVLVILIVLCALLWGCLKLEHLEWEQKIFGRPAHLTKTVFHFESKRSLMGDGQIVEVYELPKTIRSRFAAADPQLLEEFPKPPLAIGAWKSEKWRKTPLDSAHKDLLEFTLSPTHGDKSVEAIFANIRNILGKPGAFYSFLHNGNMGRMENIELLVVDISKGKLYLIRMDT